MKRSVTGLSLTLLSVALLALHFTRAGALGQITSPQDRSSVRGLVPIDGSATDPQFLKYEIHFGVEPNPGDQWSPIQGSPFSVPVVQGRLGLWDTTIIPDGVYSLRLRTVRQDGNYDEYFVRGIQVVNTQPTATPTRQFTPTPAGPTKTPVPTPTVVIAVPTVLTPTPRPTITPFPTQTPAPTSLPPRLPFGISSVSGAACWGTYVTLGVFAGLGVLLALKGSLAALIRRLTGRDREDIGV